MICRNHLDVSEGVRRCYRCGWTFCPDCLVTIGDHLYCATCKTEQLMDVRSGVDRSRLFYAGFWQRLGAWLIDYVLQIIPVYAIVGIVMVIAGMQTFAQPEPSLWLLAIYIPVFAVPILYEALMLQFKNGQTVGKLALRIRVVRPDGSRISAGQAWARPLMRLLLSCLVIIDYIPVFFTAEKTTLHDMVVGTRVVEIS